MVSLMVKVSEIHLLAPGIVLYCVHLLHELFQFKSHSARLKLNIDCLSLLYYIKEEAVFIVSFLLVVTITSVFIISPNRVVNDLFSIELHFTIYVQLSELHCNFLNSNSHRILFICMTLCK